MSDKDDKDKINEAHDVHGEEQKRRLAEINNKRNGNRLAEYEKPDSDFPR